MGHDCELEHVPQKFKNVYGSNGVTVDILKLVGKKTLNKITKFSQGLKGEESTELFK